MKAPITFAIAGFGDRGSTYASMQKLFPDRMKVVAVADINPETVSYTHLTLPTNGDV